MIKDIPHRTLRHTAGVVNHIHDTGSWYRLYKLLSTASNYSMNPNRLHQILKKNVQFRFRNIRLLLCIIIITKCGNIGVIGNNLIVLTAVPVTRLM